MKADALKWVTCPERAWERRAQVKQRMKLVEQMAKTEL